MLIMSLLLAWALHHAAAQQITLRTATSLVLVPTLVESRTGEPVYNLAARDFQVKDNGVEQAVRLDAERLRAMAMVLLVETGGSSALQFHKLEGLPVMAEALAGNTRHEIAVAEFDSRPRMVQDFTDDPAAITHALSAMEPGDGGAAIFDSVWYAAQMLEDEPAAYQRVIVLVSESRDHGSRTPVKEVVRKIGESDILVYSLTFSPARAEFWEELKQGGGGSILGTMAMAVQALRKNAAATIPELTGGRYMAFYSGRQLDHEIGMLANQVHNRYMLSFRPSNPTPGLHRLSVALRRPLDAEVLARTSYWVAESNRNSPATLREK